MAVPACVKAFILVILCSNPILKGVWITLLNNAILQLQQEVALITLQIQRLNILNSLSGLIINNIKALVNKVSSDLNLFLGPLQSFSDCVILSDLNTTIQQSAVGQKFYALNKKLHDLQRATNLSNILGAQKEKIDDQIERLQDMLNEINILCP